MRKFWSAYSLLITVLLIAGCANHPKEELVKRAVQQTEKYFSLLKGDNVDAALSLFDSKFFGVTSEKKLREVLLDIRNRIGTIKEVELLKTVQTTEESMGIESGNVIVSYKVTYSNGYAASEEFEFDTTDRVFEQIDRWSFKAYVEDSSAVKQQ